MTVRRANVDGHGVTDLVLLYARLNARRAPTAHTLKVVRASGLTLVLQVPQGSLDGMTIARLRDVNARPGVEISQERSLDRSAGIEMGP